MGNADIVRGFYESVEGGDLAGGLALLAPDCSWTEMDGLARGGTYHGPDEVREGVFFRIGGEWDGFRLTVDEVLDAGDSVVAVGTYAGNVQGDRPGARGSGRPRLPRQRRRNRRLRAVLRHGPDRRGQGKLR